MKQLFTLVVAWSVALLGGFFLIAGGMLAALGGSSYYAIAGLLMIGSGALIGRGDPRGRWLFVALWLGTLVWAVWEVGFDGLQLVPRLVAPSVLLLLVLLTALPVRRERRHAFSAIATGLLAAVGAGYAVHGNPLQAQARASASALPQAGSGSDESWGAYGGTIAGHADALVNRYSERKEAGVPVDVNTDLSSIATADQ